MKTLQQLNKINTQAVQETEAATTFEENMNIFRKYNADVEAYRNTLLKSLAGKEVTVTGYLAAEHKRGNFTLVCVEVRIDGCLVDTIHHLNVYKDILIKGYSWINGVKTNHTGDYGFHDVIEAAQQGTKSNIPPSKSMKVTCRGIVYQYRNKWSVGSPRQVEYAKGL